MGGRTVAGHAASEGILSLCLHVKQLILLGKQRLLPLVPRVGAASTRGVIGSPAWLFVCAMIRDGVG